MVGSRTISVNSSFNAIDRLPKFIDPIVDHCPSTTNVLACSVDGCHSYTRTPASSVRKLAVGSVSLVQQIVQ